MNETPALKRRAGIHVFPTLYSKPLRLVLLQLVCAGLASAQGPPRVGAVIAEANLLTRIDPIYPALSRAARVQGRVTIDVTIDREGKVTNPKITTGHPLLTEAALEAVRQWRYKPYLMNGQPTEIVTEVQLDFSLRPRPPASDVGEIQGQIRHVDGSSAAIMPVAAVLLSESGSRSTTFVARTVTDQSGAYRFSAIPPGRYHIEAGSTSPTYFPGTTNIREAAAVLMPDRANLIGMNVTMSRPVRVKARFAGGISSAALSAMKVVLTPIEVLLISNEAVAGNDGTFEFDDVLPGTYMISLFAGEPLSAAIRGTGGILEVGGSDSNELLRNPGAFVIRVQRRGGAVAGRVAREPAGQFPGLEFEIEAISLAPAANSDREKLVLSTRADGSFSLPLTQGTWLVYFSDLKGYSLQSISYGATDLLKEPLQVPATPAAEIRVNLQR